MQTKTGVRGGGRGAEGQEGWRGHTRGAGFPYVCLCAAVTQALRPGAGRGPLAVASSQCRLWNNPWRGSRLSLAGGLQSQSDRNDLQGVSRPSPSDLGPGSRSPGSGRLEFASPQGQVRVLAGARGRSPLGHWQAAVQPSTGTLSHVPGGSDMSRDQQRDARRDTRAFEKAGLRSLVRWWPEVCF